MIVHKAPKCDLPNIDKRKYLVPKVLTLGQFLYIIRKRVKVSSDKSLYIFCNRTLPVVSQ